MSAANSLDSKIISYLKKLSVKQKKTVLTVVKSFAEEQEYDPWDVPEFVAEIERRTEELKSGKVKGYTWEEVKQYVHRKAKAKVKVKVKKK